MGLAYNDYYIFCYMNPFYEEDYREPLDMCSATIELDGEVYYCEYEIMEGEPLLYIVNDMYADELGENFLFKLQSKLEELFYNEHL